MLRQKLLRDFQMDFYNDRGYRKIWQTQKDCIELDERLIYVPRIGSCRFTNAEFDTTLNFDESGRMRNSMPQKRSEIGIAVLGDSYAMGWGVNDRETFANILQDELKRPVAFATVGINRQGRYNSQSICWKRPHGECRPGSRGEVPSSKSAFPGDVQQGEKFERSNHS